MDLIKRYLHAVKGHLPLKQQDDVIAELADDLRSRVDDREAELGRPLDEDEVVAILRQLGHPAHLAARYGSWQQLIGPALFPMYVHILKFALGLALLVNVVVAAVLLATGRPPGEALTGPHHLPVRDGHHGVRLGDAGLRVDRRQGRPGGPCRRPVRPQGAV